MRVCDIKKKIISFNILQPKNSCSVCGNYIVKNLIFESIAHSDVDFILRILLSFEEFSKIITIESVVEFSECNEVKMGMSEWRSVFED